MVNFAVAFSYELGSGTINLYKYSRRYSGKNPSIIEGDILG